MKLEMFLILFILSLSAFLYLKHPNISGAYVYSEDYKGVSIKFYDEESKKVCIEILDYVPEVYLSGLKIIKVLPQGSQSVGHYYEDGVLELHGCTIDSISHELAHHKQKMEGESPYEITHHLGSFYKFEREIWSVFRFY